MTLEEIKTAVRAGKTVHVNTDAYVVREDRIGQWHIIYVPTGYCIGLTHMDEVTLNAKESAFYVAGEKTARGEWDLQAAASQAVKLLERIAAETREPVIRELARDAAGPLRRAYVASALSVKDR